jgi:hypothetical protein
LILNYIQKNPGEWNDAKDDEDMNLKWEYPELFISN